MQSDKHLNNVQELQQGKLMTQAQAPGSLAVLNFGPVPGQISPMQQAVDFEAAAGKAAEAAAMALAQACASPAAKMQPMVKNKPSWRCDVCNYETNVARNLVSHAVMRCTLALTVSLSEDSHDQREARPQHECASAKRQAIAADVSRILDLASIGRSVYVRSSAIHCFVSFTFVDDSER